MRVIAYIGRLYHSSNINKYCHVTYCECNVDVLLFTMKFNAPFQALYWIFIFLNIRYNT